ncbi:hypothetical protein PGT21_004565 [Puccinia graminis f. sp. tritici]|uniref:C2H2-type domain-containing protein n=1 Tax=Puccinia graminis f. sp. tritici TaxID=56615 RepID=A0A5B0LML9_PUCGR|nr:hypothetical protein PGT21_004565 [Puccinia graminis f. sp. tritici]
MINNDTCWSGPMTEFDAPHSDHHHHHHQQQSHQAQTQEQQPLPHPPPPYLEHQQTLLVDFDLDTYHHLFTQDIPHSFELDYSHQFNSEHINNNLTINNNNQDENSPPSFQLLNPLPPANSSSLSLSSTTSSNSNHSSSSGTSAGPPNHQPICLSSSPSWSSLDQLFLASLPQHPQSSPLFPIDLIPNPSSFDQTHDQPLNQLNNLPDFSFDTHLQDWNLSFDPTHPSSSGNPQESCNQSWLRPSDCVGFSENDSHRIVQPMFLQEQGPSLSDQYLKQSNRPSAEDEEYGDGLAPSIDLEPTKFVSPSPGQNTPYIPILPMKRLRSSHSQAEEHASSMATSDLSPATHNPSVAVEQLIQPDGQASANQTYEASKPKRAKNRTTSSSLKPHICPECGKSFPRLTSLTQHKITHNGERPFRCGFEGCTKSFTTSSNSKRHWKTHF